MFKLNLNLIGGLLASLLILASSPTLGNSKAGNFIEDSAITAAVKAKFAADEIVSASNIHVETNKGTVSLKGDTKSHTEANRAVELAFSAPGVVEVDTSKLMVQGSNQPLTDALITAKVKGLYAREKLFGEKAISVSGIHVETNDGTVYLSGKVDNKTQAENAEKLAQSIKGVKTVKSTITVKNAD